MASKLFRLEQMIFTIIAKEWLFNSVFYGTFEDTDYKKNIKNLIYKINKKKVSPDKLKKLRKCCLYVTRVRRCDGSFANSKPCVWCSKLIKCIKFKKIIYTTDNKQWISEKPSSIKTTHVSVGVRALERGEYDL